MRGENYVSVLDGKTFKEKARITTPSGPGMTIFSPDGRYGYVCSSFTPETDVISTADHKIVARVRQPSPFCPNIAATPDGEQVWFTLKDTGKTEVFEGRPPFTILKVLDTGPITNHVNIARTPKGQFAYVTVGGLNQVKVFRTVGLLPGGDHPGRQASARRMALRRRLEDLCRPRKRGRAHRHRHGQERRDRQRPDRPGATGPDLCAGRRAAGAGNARACSLWASRARHASARSTTRPAMPLRA